MNQQPSKAIDLSLLITTEGDIASGLAIAEALAERNSYEVLVTVVSSNAPPLVEQVNLRLKSLRAAERFHVESLEAEVDLITARLAKLKTLRVVLVPGLDQWNDDRKQLLQTAHATIVCYEPHTGLLEEPSEILLLGEDHRGGAKWLCEHWKQHGQLQTTNIEELKQTRDNHSVDTSTESNPPNRVVILTTSLRELDSLRKPIKAALDASIGPVLLVRAEPSWIQWGTQDYLPALIRRFVPPMEREKRQALATDLTTFSKLDFEFTALVCAATFLASFGLVQDSAAVIIGAMLVAPLMTPILGAGLSLAQGNRPLFTSSLKTILLGFAAALMTSTLFGLLLRALPTDFFKVNSLGVQLTQEMWSRTSPTIIDFLVAFVGGSAAAFARTRNHLSAALAGAAIAAALVPPIATAGLQISLWPTPLTEPDGARLAHNLIYGPILLFFANAPTIMVASSLVLWGCGVRSDHSYSRRDLWSTRVQTLLMLLIIAAAIWIVQHP